MTGRRVEALGAGLVLLEGPGPSDSPAFVPSIVEALRGAGYRAAAEAFAARYPRTDVAGAIAARLCALAGG